MTKVSETILQRIYARARAHSEENDVDQDVLRRLIIEIADNFLMSEKRAFVLDKVHNATMSAAKHLEKLGLDPKMVESMAMIGEVKARKKQLMPIVHGAFCCEQPISSHIYLTPRLVQFSKRARHSTNAGTVFRSH